MKKVLVIAPHPDDETLGCGGTLLRHFTEGDEIHWMIATEMNEASGFSQKRIDDREEEIQKIIKAYKFKSTISLGFLTARLDDLPILEVIEAMKNEINIIKPEIIYIPYRNDAHSDHAVIFDAAITCAKTFRQPFIKSIYAYETLSETEFGLKPEDPGFRPNLFINISRHLAKKLKIMNIYKDEIKKFPFPRSDLSIESLARLRGSQSGFNAAEAFSIIKEIK